MNSRGRQPAENGWNGEPPQRGRTYICRFGVANRQSHLTPALCPDGGERSRRRSLPQPRWKQSQAFGASVVATPRIKAQEMACATGHRQGGVQQQVQGRRLWRLLVPACSQLPGLIPERLIGCKHHFRQLSAPFPHPVSRPGVVALRASLQRILKLEALKPVDRPRQSKLPGLFPGSYSARRTYKHAQQEADVQVWLHRSSSIALIDAAPCSSV